MVIRKIIGLLFAVLPVQIGAAQENPYDNAIGEAISRSDWFETRARYEQSADSLSDYMRLFSGALLDHNFNNPAGAVEKIQHMYDEYNAQMGGNFFSLFWMMSDNLAKLGHFKAAHDICTSLLAQGRDYMDEGTRTAFETNAVLFGLKSQWPRMGIADADANYDIPFGVEDEQIKFTAVRGMQRIGAMLDSGGQMTIIDKQLASQLELPMSADSIRFNETRCPLALLDTLRLGTAVFVHVPCVVLPLGDTGVTDCGLILGNDILQLFPEIELDYELRKLHLRSRTVSSPDAPRNLMLNKVPYIRVELDGIPATMVWDTGASKSSVEPEFHEAHRDRLPPLQAHGRKRGKTATGDTGVTDCGLILGNDILQLFPEIELDYELRKLHLRSRTVSSPDAPRNLMLNKVPYIRVELDGIPATMVWDTGASKSSVEPEFHEAHRDRLPPLQAHGRKRGKTATGYSPVLEYAILPQMELTIGDKTGVMTNLYVIEDMPHSQLMGIPFDGTLGVLPPAEFKQLTINFQEMYFVVN